MDTWLGRCRAGQPSRSHAGRREAQSVADRRYPNEPQRRGEHVNRMEPRHGECLQLTSPLPTGQSRRLQPRRGQPHTNTGVLGSYQFSSTFSMSAGIADTHGPQINQRGNPPKAESFKTYMASLALTAPDNWGFVSGSTFYSGFVNGFSGGWDGSVFNYYAGITLNTPVKKLKVGTAFDYATRTDDAAPGGSHAALNAWALTGYTSYELTEKMSAHIRLEYAQTDANIFQTGAQLDRKSTRLNSSH